MTGKTHKLKTMTDQAMASSGPAEIRGKLYEEYEDSLFRLLMHDLAGREGRLLLAESEELANDPGSVPSAEKLEMFARRLERQVKKRKALAARKNVLKILNRSAVAVSLMMVMMFAAVTGVEAVRVKVLNLVMDIQPQYTSFQLKAGGGLPEERSGERKSAKGLEKANSGSTGAQVSWTQAYVPTYIPDGFTVADSSNKELIKRIVYKNAQIL
jgi:hypothetical protein